MKKLEIVWKKLSELKPAEYNPREISDVDFESLKNSLREYGFVEAVVINKKGVIIGGHMRVKAAIAIGLTEAPCNIVDVLPEKEKILNLALNRISGKWDEDKLGVLITQLQSEGVDIGLSGFEDWELKMYDLGPTDEVNKVKNSNGEVNVGGLGDGLDTECPRCHFRFNNET